MLKRFNGCVLPQDLQLEALRSTELAGGLGRPGSSNDLSSPPSLGTVGKLGSGIHPELVDLTCMLSPGSSSPESQREEVTCCLRSQPQVEFYIHTSQQGRHAVACLLLA